MHTEGPDIGLVKDQEVARTLADTEGQQRELMDSLSDVHTPDDQREIVQERVDQDNQTEVAKNALRHNDRLLDSMSREALAPGSTSGEYKQQSHELAVDDARQAAASYDQLVQDARAPHAEQEAALARRQLEEARRKIQELEGKK